MITEPFKSQVTFGQSIHYLEREIERDLERSESIDLGEYLSMRRQKVRLEYEDPLTVYRRVESDAEVQDAREQYLINEYIEGYDPNDWVMEVARQRIFQAAEMAGGTCFWVHLDYLRRMYGWKWPYANESEYYPPRPWDLRSGTISDCLHYLLAWHGTTMFELLSYLAVLLCILVVCTAVERFGAVRLRWVLMIVVAGSIAKLLEMRTRSIWRQLDLDRWNLQREWFKWN